MKRLILILFTGAILIGASGSLAQEFPNTMGLTSNGDFFDWCVAGPGFQIYAVNLYISNPVNPDFGSEGEERPVSWVNGFECRLWIEGDATVVGWSFPAPAIDAGINGNTVVGFAEPVPVIDGVAVVATVEIFLGSPGTEIGQSKKSPLPCDGATAFAHMVPTRPTASIDGMMAYLDADDPDDPLVGATPFSIFYDDDIVLLMEIWPVAVDQQTWGGIKALYR